MCKKTLLLLGVLSVTLMTRPCLHGQANTVKPTKESCNMADKNWKLGVQMYTFRQFSFFDTVDKVASMKLKCIEACDFGPTSGQLLVKNDPNSRFHHGMSAADREKVKQKLNDSGVALTNCYVGGFPNNEAQCRQVFDFGRDMGIKTFVSEPPQEMLEQLDKLCQEYKINLAIHNHPKGGNSPYWDPNTVLAACKGKSKWIGACPDTGHWTRSGIDPIEALKKLRGRIITVHIKDVPELGNPKAHDCILGQGKTGIAAVLTELKCQDFKGVISIEYESHPEDPFADTKACAEYVKEISKSSKT